MRCCGCECRLETKQVAGVLQVSEIQIESSDGDSHTVLAQTIRTHAVL
jgi:hypothetical protein